MQENTLFTPIGELITSLSTAAKTVRVTTYRAPVLAGSVLKYSGLYIVTYPPPLYKRLDHNTCGSVDIDNLITFIKFNRIENITTVAETAIKQAVRNVVETITLPLIDNLKSLQRMQVNVVPSHYLDAVFSGATIPHNFWLPYKGDVNIQELTKDDWLRSLKQWNSSLTLTVYNGTGFIGDSSQDPENLNIYFSRVHRQVKFYESDHNRTASQNMLAHFTSSRAPMAFHNLQSLPIMHAFIFRDITHLLAFSAASFLTATKNASEFRKGNFSKSRINECLITNMPTGIDGLASLFGPCGLPDPKETMDAVIEYATDLSNIVRPELIEEAWRGHDTIRYNVDYWLDVWAPHLEHQIKNGTLTPVIGSTLVPSDAFPALYATQVPLQGSRLTTYMPGDDQTILTPYKLPSQSFFSQPKGSIQISAAELGVAWTSKYTNANAREIEPHAADDFRASPLYHNATSPIGPIFFEGSTVAHIGQTLIVPVTREPVETLPFRAELESDPRANRLMATAFRFASNLRPERVPNIWLIGEHHQRRYYTTVCQYLANVANEIVMSSKNSLEPSIIRDFCLYAHCILMSYFSANDSMDTAGFTAMIHSRDTSTLVKAIRASNGNITQSGSSAIAPAMHETILTILPKHRGCTLWSIPQASPEVVEGELRVILSICASGPLYVTLPYITSNINDIIASTGITSSYGAKIGCAPTLAEITLCINDPGVRVNHPITADLDPLWSRPAMIAPGFWADHYADFDSMYHKPLILNGYTNKDDPKLSLLSSVAVKLSMALTGDDRGTVKFTALLTSPYITYAARIGHGEREDMDLILRGTSGQLVKDTFYSETRYPYDYLLEASVIQFLERARDTAAASKRELVVVDIGGRTPYQHFPFPLYKHNYWIVDASSLGVVNRWQLLEPDDSPVIYNANQTLDHNLERIRRMVSPKGKMVHVAFIMKNVLFAIRDNDAEWYRGMIQDLNNFNNAQVATSLWANWFSPPVGDLVSQPYVRNPHFTATEGGGFAPDLHFSAYPDEQAAWFGTSNHSLHYSGVYAQMLMMLDGAQFSPSGAALASTLASYTQIVNT